MTSVGATLRSARETQGRNIAEIAEELCLTQGYLRAIESDDLNKLPGTFFYRSFVRQYAAVLDVPLKTLQTGMDALTSVEVPQAAEPEIDRVLPPGQAIRALDPLVEASNRYFSSGTIGIPVVVLGLALLVCSGFYRWWTQAPRQTEGIAQRSGRTSTPAPRAVGLSNAELAASQDPNDGSHLLNHVVLNIEATEQVWLSITNSEGQRIFSGILQPSQTKTVAASDAAQMRVGNAGGIEVRLNGKEIGPLGGRGQVKTVRFTPDKYQIVEPPAAEEERPGDARL